MNMATPYCSPTNCSNLGENIGIDCGDGEKKNLCDKCLNKLLFKQLENRNSNFMYFTYNLIY